MPAASLSNEPSHRTALLVMRTDGASMLCPFFTKCDGLVIIDPANDLHEFHANSGSTAEATCNLVLKTGVQRIVLGFIGGPAVQKLRDAVVDVRLGSCTCAIGNLAARFDDLPPVFPI